MKDSKIEWCDHTFNPWEGCTKISPGCAHCYAEARNHRFGLDNWGKGKPRRRTSAANWKKPLQWNKTAICDCGYAEIFGSDDCRNCGERFAGHRQRKPRVFCASLSDWLDDEVPIEWLADLLKLIHDTPNLDWLLLTKRPENWASRIHKARNYMMRVDADVSVWLNDWLPKAEMPGMPARDGRAPENVWIGTSVEDQPRADERIPELEKIPAKIHFLSVEPMLENIIFPRLDGIDWAIFGGESGPNARPCNVEWIRQGIMDCKAAGVAPFVKQLGKVIIGENVQEWPSKYLTGDGYDGWSVTLSDKKGGEISEWPEDLRVREFPDEKAEV